MKAKNLFLTTTLLFSAFILGACSLFPQNNDNYLDLDKSSNSSPPNTSSTPSGASKVSPYDSNMLAINTDKGQIVIKLYPDKSPKTVANFLSKRSS